MLASLLLHGCTKSVEDVKAAHASSGAADPTQPASNVTQLPIIDPDMVAAVSGAGSDTPISLRFRLDSRPEVGKSLTVQFALVPDPKVKIRRMYLSFQPGDGLELQGEQKLDVDENAAAATVQHQLTLLPRQPGILQLRTTVVVDTATDSVTRSYVIPVIAAGAPSDSPSRGSVAN
jgi:hypothetical protein